MAGPRPGWLHLMDLPQSGKVGEDKVDRDRGLGAAGGCKKNHGSGRNGLASQEARQDMVACGHVPWPTVEQFIEYIMHRVAEPCGRASPSA